MTSRHMLAVGEEFNPDNPTDCFEVWHPETCPTETVPFGFGVDGIVHSCDVASLQRDLGVEAFFRHADDPADDAREVVAPGRYAIEAWTQLYPATPDHGEEWDAGLALAEPEERDLAGCPYWQSLNGGEPGGVCDRGCWSEPACITDEPIEGWPSQRKSK